MRVFFRREGKAGGHMKTFLKVLLWIVILILILFLTLFLSYKMAGFDTMGDLLRYLFSRF